MKDVGRNTRRVKQFSGSVYRKAKCFWDALVYGTYGKVRVNPLPIFLFLGMGGILIDLDHFIKDQTQMARPLHLPYWIIVGIVCIGYYTYVDRWIYKSSIGDK